MAQSSYDVIASEYYDDGHKTSRNFDSATRLALQNIDLPEFDGLILEVGAGRGRAQEYLKIDSMNIIQLDNSVQMLSLEDREPSLLRVRADACELPFHNSQFGGVVGFLVDPFFGLNFLSEAIRVLKENCFLFLTMPSASWGVSCRESIGISSEETRFKILGTEEIVKLPSVLKSTNMINQMLDKTGFRNINISSHSMDPADETVSPDIVRSAQSQDINVSELQIINIIQAVK